MNFGVVEQDTGSELYLGPQAVEAGGRGLTVGGGLAAAAPGPQMAH